MANQQESTLQSLAHDRLFVVPDYQRPYAWEDKQLSDLWEDLDLLGERHHYAGTVVLRQQPGRALMSKTGTTLTVWDVVDGQQRLTTTFLLLDRLRRRLATLPHADAPSVAEMLRTAYGVVSVSGVEQPRIRLGNDLNGYWQDTILGDRTAALPTLIAGQQRLRQAVAYFDQRIDGLVETSADDTFARLWDLMRRVTDGLRFLVYEVSSEADVGVIFETLNDRGRGLTEFDKIKNYLLYLAAQIGDERDADVATFVNERSSRIFQYLANLDEDRVLRGHWLATHNPDSRRWRRTASIKEAFPRAKYVRGVARLAKTSGDSTAKEALWDTLSTDIKDYVHELEQSALIIAELHNPRAEFISFSDRREQARAVSAALVRTRSVAVFYPLILAARLSHPHDGEGYTKLLTACETYAARVFVLAERRSNAGEPRMNHIAKRIYDGQPIAEAVADLNTLTWNYASDDRVREAMSVDYAWYPGTSHRYFLYEYERDLARSDDDVPDLSQFTERSGRTTEHILPQRPAEGSQWWNHFTELEYEALVHSLGNLVLTRDNSVYSNKDFADKRGSHDNAPDHRSYCTSSLQQEREIARLYGNWTPETIRNRQEHLTSWALERWKVEPPRTGDVITLEDDLGEDALDEESEDILLNETAGADA